jgi:chemotaxis protein MotB
MYEKKDNNEDINFWVSYADLMAGLLFVFILVVGAIVIKYVYVQTDLQVIKNELKEEQNALIISNESLQKKKEALLKSNNQLKSKKEEYLKINEQLKNTQNKSINLSFQLAKAKILFEQTQETLKKSEEFAKKLNLDLDDKTKNLKLSNEQIIKITQILEDKKDNIKLLDIRIKEQKISYDKIVKKLEFSFEEINKMKDLLLDYELKLKNSDDITEKQSKEIVTLNAQLNKDKNTILLRQGEIEELTKKLYLQMSEHQKLVDEFDIAKIKIKSLTGIRIKVVKALKDKLGTSIDIDEKSGSIKFSSNILFDQGKFKLKETSKNELSAILKKYIHTLLLDNNIRQYIHSITIQGHTNSDGSYLYNLELSQKRALEVMKFLYSLDIKNKLLLEKYISASGRSYSDRIRDINGFEEKDVSRRIEIKFRIKNEDAIKQLSNYLDKK